MQEKKRKQAETERKRAEVRARLEEASKAKKAKKGFMTPDRKKKLRVSSLFVSFFLNLVARSSMSPKPRDILFKNSIAVSRRKSFVIFLFPSMENGIPGVNAAPGLQKYVLYCISTVAASNVHRQPSRTPRSRFTLLPHCTP